MAHGHITKSFPPKHDHDLCVADALDEAEKYCKNKGLRWTPLRAQVLELVWAHHKPVRAYDILETLSQARSQNGDDGGTPKGRTRVAPPTVYRALDFLLEHGFVHRIDSLNAFIGCGEIGHTDNTYFLICHNCGEAAELHDRALTEALSNCAAKANFEVESETVEIAGICPKCQVETSKPA